MNQINVINAIKLDCASLYGNIIEKEVSEETVMDTQLPALVISQLDTVFVARQDVQTMETYNVKLLIMIEDNCTDVLTDLLTKQKATISALLARGSNLRKVTVTDGIELKDSSASNTVKQYKFGTAVVCILNIICRVVEEY